MVCLFNKVAVLQACNLNKKRLQHMSFTANIAKFKKKTPILKNICQPFFLALLEPLSILLKILKIEKDWDKNRRKQNQ